MQNMAESYKNLNFNHSVKIRSKHSKKISFRLESIILLGLCTKNSFLSKISKFNNPEKFPLSLIFDPYLVQVLPQNTQTGNINVHFSVSKRSKRYNFYLHQLFD